MAPHASSTEDDCTTVRNDPKPLVQRKSREPSLLHRSLNSRPHVVKSASSCYLFLEDGRRILDGCAGAAVAVIGHGSQVVADAMVEQSRKVSYVHTLAYTTSAAEDLADLLLEGNPFGFSKAFFVGSGSEATDSAIKLSRQYFFEKGQTQKTKFVSRQQAYHGNTVAAMSLSSNMARRIPYENAIMLPEVSFVSAANAYRGQKSCETEDQYAARLIAELDQHFQSLGPDTVAAFIAETVVGATAGCLVAPRGYFSGVRRVCDRYGILLILDEVMCGTGRTGTYFAFEQEGDDVAPDIVTIGKGLGGGYAPIAGMLIGKRIVDSLRQGSASFNHGHTYQAHPMSCAAALAVQRVIRDEDLVRSCAAKGRVLAGLLHEAFAHHEHVGEIRGRGLFWGIEFVEDRKTKKPFKSSLDVGSKIQQKAFDLGLAVYPGRGTVDGWTGDHVLLAPPLVIQLDELSSMVNILRKAVVAVLIENMP
jgi:adenosylmethionine-8-amino-7-oxononanoate aminotransferase